VVTVNGDLDLSNDTGRLVGRILASVAAGETERKAARQTLANAQRAAAGQPTSGRRPFGYAHDRLTLCEPEAALIRRAYADLLAGVSLAEITRQWEASGVAPTQPRTLVTPEGSPWGPRSWHRNSVRVVLLNPRNAGLRAYRGEIVATAQWPPIVDEQTWRAACAIIEDPARRTSPSPARKWLLSGIAACGRCGGPMKAHWGTPKVGPRRRRYVCTDHRHLTREAGLADHVVTQAIIGRLARADARDLLIDSDRPDLAALSTQADVLRRRQDDFADGAITASQLRTGSEKLRAALTHVQQRMAHGDRAPCWPT
jgi:site-specific DNA recombinase